MPAYVHVFVVFVCVYVRVCTCQPSAHPTARLEEAAVESQKSVDVDLNKLLSAHNCCCLALQRLLSLERNAIRIVRTSAALLCFAAANHNTNCLTPQAGIEQLLETLAQHQKILQEKRLQLETCCTSDPGQCVAMLRCRVRCGDYWHGGTAPGHPSRPVQVSEDQLPPPPPDSWS